MSKKEKPLTVTDHDEAFEVFESPVQCGDCYTWYEAINHDACPICGGTEWVGSR